MLERLRPDPGHGVRRGRRLAGPRHQRRAGRRRRRPRGRRRAGVAQLRDHAARRSRTGSARTRPGCSTSTPGSASASTCWSRATSRSADSGPSTPRTARSCPGTTPCPTCRGPSRAPEVREAIDWVREHFGDNPGDPTTFRWPTDHAEAESSYDAFLAERFSQFGPYEDAIAADGPWLFHALLTPGAQRRAARPARRAGPGAGRGRGRPALAGGVRAPGDRLAGVHAGDLPPARARGCAPATGSATPVRWPTGWWTRRGRAGPGRPGAGAGAEHGYAHHIERLMVLGNAMCLLRTEPDAAYEWFMEMFVDAYDWVMVPNVYAMSQFAAGEAITTKPYVSGSNYLRKMSDFPIGGRLDRGLGRPLLDVRARPPRGLRGQPPLEDDDPDVRRARPGHEGRPHEGRGALARLSGVTSGVRLRRLDRVSAGVCDASAPIRRAFATPQRTRRSSRSTRVTAGSAVRPPCTGPGRTTVERGARRKPKRVPRLCRRHLAECRRRRGRPPPRTPAPRTPTSGPARRRGRRARPGSTSQATSRNSSSWQCSDDPDVEELLAVGARHAAQHDVLVGVHPARPSRQPRPATPSRRARRKATYAERSAPGDRRPARAYQPLVRAPSATTRVQHLVGDQRRPARSSCAAPAARPARQHVVAEASTAAPRSARREPTPPDQPWWKYSAAPWSISQGPPCQTSRLGLRQERSTLATYASSQSSRPGELVVDLDRGVEAEGAGQEVDAEVAARGWR